MKSTKHSAIGIGLFLSFCGCQRYSDSLDQQALRTQCHIPAYAKLTNYEGFPQVVGFGQREGLRITGYFEIPKSEIGTFEKSIQAEAWMPLPIPADLLLTFPPQGKGLERLLEVADGFFRCHTAGDEVLHATKTRPCAEAKPTEHRTPVWDANNKMTYKSSWEFSDLILSVYDRKRGIVIAHIEASY